MEIFDLLSYFGKVINRRVVKYSCIGVYGISLGDVSYIVRVAFVNFIVNKVFVRMELGRLFYMLLLEWDYRGERENLIFCIDFFK